MPSRLTLTTMSHNGEGSMYFDVEEDYETVLNLMIPIDPPSSALAARQVNRFHKVNGGGMLSVHPNLIGCVEELTDADR